MLVGNLLHPFAGFPFPIPMPINDGMKDFFRDVLNDMPKKFKDAWTARFIKKVEEYLESPEFKAWISEKITTALNSEAFRLIGSRLQDSRVQTLAKDLFERLIQKVKEETEQLPAPPPPAPPTPPAVAAATAAPKRRRSRR